MRAWLAILFCLIATAAFGQAIAVPSCGSVTITAGGLHYPTMDMNGGLCTRNSGGGGGGLPPVNTARPVVSGTPTVGSTLSTTNGTWSNSPTGYSYQWWQMLSPTDSPGSPGSSAIGGATSSSLVVASPSTGLYIGVLVTATNAYGSASAYNSANAGPVTAGGSTCATGDLDYSVNGCNLPLLLTEGFPL